MAGGLGVAALAAAAAATYYFYGKGGNKHRAKVKSWTHSAKTEVLKQIKGMNKISRQAYGRAVKQVLAKYKHAKKIDPAELAALGVELKGYWDNISKSITKLSAKPKAKPGRRKPAARKTRKNQPA